MSDDVLSQDEINALLDDDNGEENEEQQNGEATPNADEPAEEELLNEMEKDAIGEVGNISMGSAATALYSLLDTQVEITAPEVKITTFNKLINEYERPCVLVDVDYVEGLEGVNLLIIQTEDAAIIADLMMGGDGSEPDEELTDLHLSAVGEAMNQMMGSASTSMSDFMHGQKVNISPPNAELLTLNTDEVEQRSLDPEGDIAKISFNLSIGDLIDSEIIQIMEIDFAKELVAYLMDPGSEEEEAQEEVAVSDNGAAAQQQSQEAAPQQQQQQVAAQQTQQQPQQPVQGPAAQQPGQQSIAASKSGAVSSQGDVEVQSVQFSELGAGGQAEIPSNIALIQDVPLEVTVRLGKTKMLIKEVLELGNGSVIELDKLAGESVDLLVNGKLIAKGEVVVIDENFGFRVTDIVSPQERLNSL
ncbi:flagellar motor switch phosphatase FliY [Fuchsiella alkaliacetigena]|uniref:flagellar motor switch phosphatase FliY n=1 Tax=Fuchsiella alkaliacetigena TaxID=957042 RepID=UPI00200BA071|nr:flagellar motor switch phosphatase FliY [Fuchsiella alkaliacetigena]MCK8823540.1 flagellar motor switch phosphatase FliY [Fuchsiella alkaliacetigena]